MTIKSPVHWYRILTLLLLNAALAAQAGAVEREKSGGWRLALESSPYLQLHADNPVTWYPWGEAALQRARRENKPLFISIGYFTCHWCHVMARESFSHPEIAALLNEHFISIKIDREQRPDLDNAYMSYVMATRGHGGWPMSVWATPDGKPFLGGTYFPPDAKLGRPGMKQILTRLAELWKEDPQAMIETAGRAVAMLRKLESSVAPLQRLTDAPLIEARRQLAGNFDELQGGFGPAPKFPQPARLLFLLADAATDSAAMALLTLDRMAAGGIQDQLEGGFHRYSTDFEWRVPHFEKMLYDQALIARAYMAAYRRTGKQQYAATARSVLDFTLAQMQHPQGGFYSALSADSAVSATPGAHLEEGAYYTWTWQQLTDALGDDDLRAWAAAWYGVEEQGNALADPLGEMAGRNVLYRARDIEELSAHFKTDPETARRRIAAFDARLLTARRKRPAVPVDDKLVTVWNGYMITTLAGAARLLDEPRYLHAAESAARFMFANLHDAGSGQLFRDWRAGVRGVPGFSEDYAAMAEGLLALYRVTGDKHWLQRARRLVDTRLLLYWDKDFGGFYSTLPDAELWLREKPAADGATLTVNGVALQVLQQLGKLTGEPAYHHKAWQTAAWLGAQLADAPAQMPYALMAWPALPDTVKSVEEETPNN
ncbi:MAG: thioredoxin domain-containing protein [Gammaproteobacteria bacterium]